MKRRIVLLLDLSSWGGEKPKMQPETVIKGNIHMEAFINKGSSSFYLEQE